MANCRVELIMDKRTRRWLVNYAKANYWRVATHMDLEDLVQDGFVVWHKIQQRYREQGRKHPHIVNTFKTAYRNHIHDLANDKWRASIEVPVPDVDQAVRAVEPGPQDLAAALARAPFRVREALAVFASAEGRASLRKPYRRRGDGSRETLNDRLCRLAGFDPSRVDLVGALRTYFSTD